MSSFFLDTNVLIYTFDDRAPDKRDRARTLVSQALSTRQGLISYQVVQEFLNVATRKFERPMTRRDAAEYLDRVLAPLCEVHSSIDSYRTALELQERWGYSFYDSRIVGAALAAGCERLYSEELQDGQQIGELTIENPFS